MKSTKKRAFRQLISGTTLFLLFVLFTWSLTWVHVQPVGPGGSAIAYADINLSFHHLTGVHMSLYHITDWLGLAVLLLVPAFALLGLLQWIRRGSILRVDRSILLLGVFYLFVFSAYAFFEVHVINYRPILIDGIAEASYPSSTTMLALCVLPTAMMQFRCLIRSSAVKNTVNSLCGLLTAFLVIARAVCGVHWATDVLGGLLLSAALVLLYCAADNYLAAMAEETR